MRSTGALLAAVIALAAVARCTPAAASADVFVGILQGNGTLSADWATFDASGNAAHRLAHLQLYGGLPMPHSIAPAHANGSAFFLTINSSQAHPNTLWEVSMATGAVVGGSGVALNAVSPSLVSSAQGDVYVSSLEQGVAWLGRWDPLARKVAHVYNLGTNLVQLPGNAVVRTVACYERAGVAAQ